MNHRFALVAAAIVIAWASLAWNFNNWYWSASLLYATASATLAAFVVAAFGRPPYKTISLAFGIGCIVPLAYKFLAHPGRLLGYALLPVDVSYYRRDLGDVLTVLCIGTVAAFVASYASRRLVATV